MNHDGSPTIRQDVVRRISSRRSRIRNSTFSRRAACRRHRQVVDRERLRHRPIHPNRQILRHIPGMVAHRILQPMLLLLRVEVATGSLEIRPVTYRILMNMHGVIAFGRFFRSSLMCSLVPLSAGGKGKSKGSSDGTSRSPRPVRCWSSAVRRVHWRVSERRREGRKQRLPWRRGQNA